MKNLKSFKLVKVCLLALGVCFFAFAGVKAIEPPDWLCTNNYGHWDKLSTITQQSLIRLRELFASKSMNHKKQLRLDLSKFDEILKKMHNLIIDSPDEEKVHLYYVTGFYPLSQFDEDMAWVNSSQLSKFFNRYKSSISGHFRGHSYLNQRASQNLSPPEFLSNSNDPQERKRWMLRTKKLVIPENLENNFNTLSEQTQADLDTLRDSVVSDGKYHKDNAGPLLEDKLKRIHNFIEISPVYERPSLCKAIGLCPLSKDNENEFWINTSTFKNFIGPYADPKRLNELLKKLSYKSDRKGNVPPLPDFLKDKNNNTPHSSQSWTLRRKTSENQNIAFAAGGAQQLPLNVPALPATTAQ